VLVPVPFWTLPVRLGHLHAESKWFPGCRPSGPGIAMEWVPGERRKSESEPRRPV